MKDPEKNEKGELLRALYLQRRTHKEIAAATNLSIRAVQKRINRAKLRKLRNEAEAAVPARVLTVAQCDEHVSKVVALDLVKTADSLGEIPHSKDPATAKTRADLVHTIAGTCEKVFSWNSPGSGPNSGMFDFRLIDSTYAIDMETLTKSNGKTTLPLTAAEIAECRALDEQMKNGNAIDISSTNGEARNGS